MVTTILWTIGLVLLWLSGLLLALTLLFFLVPFGLRLRGHLEGSGGEGEVAFGWGGGLITVRAAWPRGAELRLAGLPLYRASWTRLLELARKGDEEEQPEKKVEAEPEEKKGRRPGHRGGFSLARVRKLVAIVMRLLRTIRVRGWVAGTVGLDDPADTAALAGALAPLNRLRGRFTVSIQPCWTDELVDLAADVRVNFWLPRTAWVLLLTWLDPEARRALRFN